ncbi:MAG: hypothetical protein Q4E13_00420 [Clostridia bacterium]|nr:hypothetical protein [Clostridia bacterium]
MFFDRDGVLTEPNPEVRAAFRAQVEAWSGRPYAMDSDRMMRLFDAAGYPKGGLKGVAEELEFWLRYLSDCWRKRECEKTGPRGRHG